LGAPVRLLTFTTLYPHAGLPNQGIFVENRLRHLVGTGKATSTVLAPVPWFPSRHPRFGAWSRFAMAEAEELRHGLRVLHPRYAVIPKIGMVAAPAALYAAAKRVLARLLRQGLQVDVIDSHYLYPDGVVGAGAALRPSGRHDRAWVGRDATAGAPDPVPHDPRGDGRCGRHDFRQRRAEDRDGGPRRRTRPHYRPAQRR